MDVKYLQHCLCIDHCIAGHSQPVVPPPQVVERPQSLFKVGDKVPDFGELCFLCNIYLFIYNIYPIIYVYIIYYSDYVHISRCKFTETRRLVREIIERLAHTCKWFDNVCVCHRSIRSSTCTTELGITSKSSRSPRTALERRNTMFNTAQDLWSKMFLSLTWGRYEKERWYSVPHYSRWFLKCLLFYTCIHTVQ